LTVRFGCRLADIAARALPTGPLDTLPPCGPDIASRRSGYPGFALTWMSAVHNIILLFSQAFRHFLRGSHVRVWRHRHPGSEQRRGSRSVLWTECPGKLPVGGPQRDRPLPRLQGCRHERGAGVLEAVGAAHLAALPSCMEPERGWLLTLGPFGRRRTADEMVFPMGTDRLWLAQRLPPGQCEAPPTHTRRGLFYYHACQSELMSPTRRRGSRVAAPCLEPEAGIEPAIYRLQGGCFAIKPLRLAQGRIEVFRGTWWGDPLRTTPPARRMFLRAGGSYPAISAGREVSACSDTSAVPRWWTG
jgi:hypothetical protein